MSVRLLSFGRTRFAFGLTWQELPARGSALAAARRGVGKESAGLVYGEVKSATGTRHVGYGLLPAAGRKGGPIVSAASVLAESGDGIYIAAVGQNLYWLVFVTAGLVVTGTDVLGDEDSTRALLEDYRLATGRVEVHVSDFEEEGAKAFALDEILSHVPRRFPRLVVPGSRGKQALALVLVLAAVALGGWGVKTFVLAPTAVQVMGPSPEEAARAAREAWVAQVRAVVGDVPGDARWAVRAVQDVAWQYPPDVGGWLADRVDCIVSGCVATYVRGDGASILSVLRERFGTRLRGPGEDGKVVQVDFPLPSSPLLPIDETTLRMAGVARRSLPDWLGLLSATVPGATVTPPQVSRLDHGPEDFPGIEVVKVTAQGDFADPAVLDAVIRYGWDGGFVPVTLYWSDGWAMAPAGWKLDLVRVSALSTGDAS